MGYRSDVKLITTKAGWERLENAVSQAQSKYAREYWITSEVRTMTLCDDKYVLAEWDDIKWYASFEDVGAFMKELYDMAKEHVAFKFLRVGEDYEDVERLESEDEGGVDYYDMPGLWPEHKIIVEY